MTTTMMVNFVVPAVHHYLTKKAANIHPHLKKQNLQKDGRVRGVSNEVTQHGKM